MYLNRNHGLKFSSSTLLHLGVTCFQPSQRKLKFILNDTLHSTLGSCIIILPGLIFFPELAIKCVGDEHHSFSFVVFITIFSLEGFNFGTFGIAFVLGIYFFFIFIPIIPLLIPFVLIYIFFILLTPLLALESWLTFLPPLFSVLTLL